MKGYRRIEINAYRRRVTLVSGEWRPSDAFDAELAETDDGVSLNDSDLSEPVSPDSPEGQLLLVEAVRSLERRLSPEARARIRGGQDALTLNPATRNGFCLKLQSLYQLIRRKARR